MLDGQRTPLRQGESSEATPDGTGSECGGQQANPMPCPGAVPRCRGHGVFSNGEGADHRRERRSDVRLRPTPPLVGRNRLNRMCVSDGHGLRLLPLRHPRHPALQLLPVLRTDDTLNARGQGAETLSVSDLSAVFSRRLNVGDPGIHWETFPIMDSGNRLPGRSELLDLLLFPAIPCRDPSGRTSGLCRVQSACDHILLVFNSHQSRT